MTGREAKVLTGYGSFATQHANPEDESTGTVPENQRDINLTRAHGIHNAKNVKEKGLSITTPQLHTLHLRSAETRSTDHYTYSSIGH